jgi:hypothetical protein
MQQTSGTFVMAGPQLSGQMHPDLFGASRLALHASPARGYRLAAWGGVCPPPAIAAGYGWSAIQYRARTLKIVRNFDTYITDNNGFLVGYPNSAGVITVTARFVIASTYPGAFLPLLAT